MKKKKYHIFCNKFPSVYLCSKFLGAVIITGRHQWLSIYFRERKLVHELGLARNDEQYAF